MRRGAPRWMFNWVLCVMCVYFSLRTTTSSGWACVFSAEDVCMCEEVYVSCQCVWISEASSLPSSWHLSLGRASCGVSLIKASTVWLMNRLCGISAPGWRSHSAAPRLLWGPPFYWALNQETALITLPPPPPSPLHPPLPSALSPSSPPPRSSLFILPTLSLRSAALFLCPSYLPACLSASLCTIMPHPWVTSGRRGGEGIFRSFHSRTAKREGGVVYWGEGQEDIRAETEVLLLLT